MMAICTSNVPSVVLYVICLLLLQFPRVWSQGRLQLPLGRSSLWRAGVDTPKNYDDHMLECGGLWYKKKRNNECGLCGDPVDGPLENEAGGKYDTEYISALYKPGERTQFKANLMTNQGGYFQFKLCVPNSPSQRVTQECFDKHEIPLADQQSNSKYYLPEKRQGIFAIDVFIPAVTCDRCVLQWSYVGGNEWGVHSNGSECKGCGPQYELRNCADIAITQGTQVPIHPALQAYNENMSGRNSRGTNSFDPPFNTPLPVQTPDPWFNPPLPVQTPDPWFSPPLPVQTPDPWFNPPPPVQTPDPWFNPPLSVQTPDPWFNPPLSVQTPDPWINAPDSTTPAPLANRDSRFDIWAKRPPTAPPTVIVQQPQIAKFKCVALGTKSGMVGMDDWCSNNCNQNYCPALICSCQETSQPESSPLSLPSGNSGFGASVTADPWLGTDLPLQLIPKKAQADPWPSDSVKTVSELICVAIGTKEGMEGMDQWCADNCKLDYCPTAVCQCQ